LNHVIGRIRNALIIVPIPPITAKIPKLIGLVRSTDQGVCHQDNPEEGSKDRFASFATFANHKRDEK